MRTLFFIGATMLFTSTAFAQNDIKYCDLDVSPFSYQNAYSASVNYSEAPKKKFDNITNKDGKPQKFSSEMEALNYMTKQGWYLIAAYHDRGETHFFLKKDETK